MMEQDERTSIYRKCTASSAPVALLRATLPSGALATLPLGTRPVTIKVGRHPSCDWQLDDPTVSRRHALLRWSGRELTIEDLGSSSGTTIDAEPVAAVAQPLAPGQHVCLGDAAFHLELIEAAPAATTEAELLAAEETLVIKNPLVEEMQAAPRPATATSASAPAAVIVEDASDDAVDGPVYVPERDALGPHEETRSWPVEAALARSREPLFSLPKLSSLLRRRARPEPPDEKREPTEPIAWRRAPRLAIVAGPALLAAVSCASTFWPKPAESAAATHAASEPAATATTAASRRPRTAPPAPRAPTAPLVTSLAPAAAPPPATDPPPSPDERDAALAGAIHAYKNGDRTQALLRFRQLARDPSDATAKFMARLVELQQASEGQ